MRVKHTVLAAAMLWLSFPGADASAQVKVEKRFECLGIGGGGQMYGADEKWKPISDGLWKGPAGGY